MPEPCDAHTMDSPLALLLQRQQRRCDGGYSRREAQKSKVNAVVHVYVRGARSAVSIATYNEKALD